MKKVLTSIGLLAVLVGLALWISPLQTNIATFVCSGEKSIIATFYPRTDTYVDLRMSDGRSLSVPHAVFASGARYTNADESFVFWNKGNRAFVEENGGITYADCRIPEPGAPAARDPKDATYVVEGRPVTLSNGLSEVEASPGSATKIVTRYFGNEVKHDLNDDSREDVAFLLTQETGGSGTFFYVVAALNTPAGYVGSRAVFLGDRIAPQSTSVDEGKTTNGTDRRNVIVVNYAVRAPGEPFTAQPSVGKSVWLKLDPNTMQFGEVAQNFEGESR